MRSISALAGVGLAAAAVAAAAGPAAAAQPHAGTYAGPTTQPESTAYSGRIRLATVRDGSGYRVAKVTARMKLDCQGDPARIEKYTVSIPISSGAVASTGRFKATIETGPTTGFTIKGRFVSRTRARGTFGRSDASTGCYVGDVKWTAALR